MPQFDSKFTLWFGIWTNLLLFIAGYGVDHAPAIVAQYAPSVQWLCGLLGQANGIILTALVGLSSKQTTLAASIGANPNTDVKAGPHGTATVTLVDPAMAKAALQAQSNA